MQRKYFWFNLMCLSASACFATGIVFVYARDVFVQNIINVSDIKSIQIEHIEQAQRLNNLNTSTITQNAEKRDSSSTNGQTRNDTVDLAVPFTSQAPEKNWEQPWQDACEEAALLMLDAYYKNYNLSPLFAKDELLKMIKWEEEQSWGVSIEMEKVKEMAEEYLKISNLKSQISNFVIVENPTVEQIKKSIASGNPVLMTADGKALPNPHYRNDGPVYHALIIKGYTEIEFITNDPGTQFGKDFKYKYADLLNAIRDWNNGDVKNGRRAVLAVE